MAILEKKKVENNGVMNDVMGERKRELEAVKTTTTPKARAKNDVLFSIRTTKEKQIQYKTFFASKNLSISKGVQIAIDYLIDQANKGNIELKDTGIFTR